MTGDDGNYGPMLMLTDDKMDEVIEAFDAKIDSLQQTETIAEEKLNAIKEFVGANGLAQVRPVLHHSFEKMTPKEGDDAYFDDRKKTDKGGEPDLVEGVAGKAVRFDDQYDIVEIHDFGQFEMNEI